MISALQEVKWVWFQSNQIMKSCKVYKKPSKVWLKDKKPKTKALKPSMKE